MKVIRVRKHLEITEISKTSESNEWGFRKLLEIKGVRNPLQIMGV